MRILNLFKGEESRSVVDRLNVQVDRSRNKKGAKRQSWAERERPATQPVLDSQSFSGRINVKLTHDIFIGRLKGGQGREKEKLEVKF